MTIKLIALAAWKNSALIWARQQAVFSSLSNQMSSLARIQCHWMGSHCQRFVKYRWILCLFRSSIWIPFRAKMTTYPSTMITRKLVGRTSWPSLSASFFQLLDTTVIKNGRSGEAASRCQVEDEVNSRYNQRYKHNFKAGLMLILTPAWLH